AYGNFYSTEPITTNAFPALRYQDGLGNTRVVYMPRPVAPTVPGSCNFCHQIAIPPTVFENLSEFDDPKYLRISTGVVSSAGADTNYHLSIVPGPNCLDGACHGSPGTATLFTMAGAVQQTETGDLYTLADAALGLFPEECDDQRYNCQSGATDPVLRTKTPKLFIGINSLGHFYTTQPIDWTLPTYPTLANYDANNACRNIKHMLSAVPQANTGNCYSCHDGATQPPITIMGILDPKNPVEKCAPPPPELPESG
ncbi:MAG: hypothetical protein LJE85_16250, partial [Gammaproteobacteria bacterium]|nr:hypothetical protein [Gammaproteobacteria bacterium]